MPITITLSIVFAIEKSPIISKKGFILDTRATLIRKEIWAKGSDLAKFARLKKLDLSRLRQFSMGLLKEAPEIEEALLEFGVSEKIIQQTKELYRKKHPLKNDQSR